jgi:glucose-1-phosphate thymidylyltransferase
MKAVIPTAGKGTRLYPHTHTKPKPMVRLAGRPLLGHILSGFVDTRVDEVVLVVGGPMQNQIVEYADARFGDQFEFTFAEQESPEGLGHSIHQAEPHVCGDGIVIALGDMLFANSYRLFLDAHERFSGADGSIGVKRVDKPQRYGVAEFDDDGRVTSLVEKPDDPPSEMAIAGVYVVEDTPALFDVLAYLIDNGVRGAGNEFQLTDAFARMVDAGADLRGFEVEEWYDCGRPETLLEANRVLLSEMPTDGDGHGNAVVVPPVDLGDDVAIEASVVGPHVSVDDGATIDHSIIRDSIVGRDARLDGINVEHSIVGDNAEATGDPHRLNVGDNSAIEF